MTRKALGRGLEALIPRASGEQAPSRLEKGMARVDQIRPNPWQPRSNTDPLKMDELVRSVQTRGILEPLLVRRTPAGFELVAGERRLRAAQRAGMEEVPIIIIDLDDIGTLEVALIENVQREELNPVDEARAYQILAGEFGRTHDEIASQVGKDRSTVSNLMRILKLPQDILDAVATGTITVGHARTLLAFPEPKEQLRWFRKLLKRGWSVREIERLVARVTRPARPIGPVGERTRDPHLDRVEEAIRRRVGSEVRLRLTRKGASRVEFFFADQEDLERFLEILNVRVH